MKGEAIAVGVLGLLGIGWIITKKDDAPSMGPEPSPLHITASDEFLEDRDKLTDEEKRKQDLRTGVNSDGELIVTDDERTVTINKIDEKIPDWVKESWTQAEREGAISFRDVPLEETMPYTATPVYTKQTEVDTSRAKEPEQLAIIKTDGSLAVHGAIKSDILLM